jgi:S1/P1 Nuclease
MPRPPALLTFSATSTSFHEPLRPPGHALTNRGPRLVTPFAATHPKNSAVTPFPATHTKWASCKSFPCHTCRKGGVWGVLLLTRCWTTILAGRLTAALLLCALAFAPRATAWGCRGHETVAMLAEKHLDPQAKQALLALLTANPIDPQLKRYCGQTGQDAFADSSTWADDERSRDPKTAPWHFIDIPIGVAHGSAKDFCGTGGCVLTAIVDQLAILKDKNAPGAKRAAALRFIIHFVADLHQPLHGSTNSDRGANCVPVKYFGRNPHARNNSYTPNLHHVWDTEIPESQMQGADPAEFADTLDAAFASSFTAWQQGGMQLEAWAWESHRHAVQTAYGALSKPFPVEPEVPVSTCADDNNIGQRMLLKHYVIGTIYRDRAGSVVEKRLAQAGIRLAMILNEAAKAGL